MRLGASTARCGLEYRQYSAVQHPLETKHHDASSAALCSLLAFFAAFAAAAFAFLASARAAYKKSRELCGYGKPYERTDLFGFLLLFCLFLCPLLLCLLLCFRFPSWRGLPLALFLGIACCLLFLFDALDSWVQTAYKHEGGMKWKPSERGVPQRQIDNIPQTCGILFFSASPLSLVLLLGVTLVIATTRCVSVWFCHQRHRRTCHFPR